jgi:ketosteroid isomerase-like protein
MRTAINKRQTKSIDVTGESEAAIRLQIDYFIKAFCTKDLNLMMSLYTFDFVSFDIVPPLQCVGRDAYRIVWKETFELFRDTIKIEMRDLHITVSHDVAFSHKLLRLQATRVNGHDVDYWERLTFCFRKIDNNWLIAHEHVSVPADFSSGKAVLDLTP